MSEAAQRTFSSDFRKFFLRGLAVILPSVLTLWIVVKAYQFVDKSIAEPINGGVRVAMNQIGRVWEPVAGFEPFMPTETEITQARIEAGYPPHVATRDGLLITELRGEKISAWWKARWYMDLIGLGVALLAVYVTGHLVGGFLGRRTYKRIENLITTLPVFKQVYPHVKQIVDFLFSGDRPIKISRVVALEYPRKGIWSVGFLTGDSMKSITTRAGDSVTVFIPSSPTPFTGYTLTVPREEVIELPITVEEAIRFAVSGGVLVPDRELDAAARERLPDGPIKITPVDGASQPASSTLHETSEEKLA